MRTLATMVAVTALVAGCAVGPDYARPQTDAPAKWRIDYPQAADVANTRWWEQFGDPVLNRLIEEARTAPTSSPSSRPARRRSTASAIAWSSRECGTV